MVAQGLSEPAMATIIEKPAGADQQNPQISFRDALEANIRCKNAELRTVQPAGFSMAYGRHHLVISLDVTR